MYQIEVRDAPPSEDLIEQILRLDRANMTPILSASRMEFPESRLRATLSSPTVRVIAAHAGMNLAAYVEYGPDVKVPGGVYVYSLQVDAHYRRGIALAEVIVGLGVALSRNPPSQIRLDVQRANASARSLFQRLGFVIYDENPQSPTLRAIASPEILNSSRFQRLRQRRTRAAA